MTLRQLSLAILYTLAAWEVLFLPLLLLRF